MKCLLLITAIMASTLLRADLISCEQQQSLCEAQCKATSLVTEKYGNTCTAQCLGERTTCELAQGKETATELAEKAKENLQSMIDKLKAFWDGLSGS